MRRPQSAKPGYKGYWGQGSQSQLQDQQSVPKGGYRKNVKLMKPDLTTNDFARILPKKIYQDKQRLYSEALQLKQNLNETLQQNIRLKTRITILQKEKDKMTKHLEINQQKGALNKANSRVNIYNSKSGQKENMMIRNLKKLVRQGKQENGFLKQQNAKIKKAIKYTKINEIEIEKKILFDQNKRYVNMLQDMNQQLLKQDDFVREINDLKRKIEYQEEAYSQVREANEKYEEYIQQLEQKRAMQNEKSQNKQNKLQRELALNKRKLNEVTRQAEELKKQLNTLRLGNSSIKPQSNVIKSSLGQSKVESQKPKLTRPMSSNPYKSQGLVGVRMTTQTKRQEDNKENQQLKNVQLENQHLKEQLNKAKLKLQQTERQKQKEKEKLLEQKNKQQSKRNPSQKRVAQNNFMQDKKVGSRKQIKSIKQQNAKSPQKKYSDDQEKYYDDAQENYSDNYGNEFQEHKEEKSIKLESKISNNKEDAQIDQYRKDFQAQQEEQPLYVKENESKKKQKEKKDDKKKKDKKQTTGGYKPNKKVLTQMKELLTYRMKAQRYPYDQLKKDIESAKQQQFSFNDLKGMFINEPFYLTDNYANYLLQYCFQSQNPKATNILSNQILLTKLRKVIEDFELIDEKEEQEMLLRIAQMVTEYPDELETAFQKIKNGEQTVARKDLIQMFQNLQLQQKYIELIIQQLSLCSADLDHLNFIGFFERFYVENMSGVQNGQIDEQQMQSSSQQVTKNFKSKDSKKFKEIKAQFEDNDYNLEVDDGQRISLGGGDKYEDDNDDVVSDDGPI